MTRSQEIHDQNKEIFDSDQKIKFALKKANFMKKSGFYLQCLEQIDEIQSKFDDKTQKYIKFRVLRDKARVLAILNRMPQAIESFESAEAVLGETKENNIKFPKLIYLKGLASKRISADVSIQTFEEASILFSKILKTDQNYFIS